MTHREPLTFQSRIDDPMDVASAVMLGGISFVGMIALAQPQYEAEYVGFIYLCILVYLVYAVGLLARRWWLVLRSKGGQTNGPSKAGNPGPSLGPTPPPQTSPPAGPAPCPVPSGPRQPLRTDAAAKQLPKPH